MVHDLLKRIAAKWTCLVFGSLIIASFMTPASADNWPGWRGDGSGVSQEEQGLPTTWGPEENVLWKTPIPGDGVSSPIIWEDKILLTTAIEWPAADARRSRYAAVFIGLLALLLVGALLGLMRRRKQPVSGSPGPGWLQIVWWIDRGVTGLALLLFAVSIYSLARKLSLGPEGVDPGTPGGFLPYSIDLQGLFTESAPRLWIIAGKFGVLGAVAAIGSVRARSAWRLAGAFLLGVAAVLFHFLAPKSVGSTSLPFKTMLVVSGPMIVAAIWYLLTFVLARLMMDGEKEPRGLWVAGALYPGGVLAAVALSFFTVNYLQAQVGLQRSVICLDRETGEVLWESMAFSAPAEAKYKSNSHATPTPATDGACVVAYYGHGLVCMDMDGNVKWRKMEPEYMDYLRYGVGNSPVLYGDRVFHTFMAEYGEEPRKRGEDFDDIAKHSYLAALDKNTGEELWRAEPPAGSAHDSYGTPLVVTSGDRTAVLFTTYHHAMAFDAETGDQIWVVKTGLEQPVPSFVADEDTAYLTGGIHGPATAAAITLGGTGDISETHLRWKITTGITGVSSPVLYDGLLYWVKENGIAYCIDAENGELVWRERIPSDGKHHGSIIAGDGKIYIPAVNGHMAVIKAGREFELLAMNEIGEDSYTSPAISQGRLYIRGKDHLFCIERPES